MRRRRGVRSRPGDPDRHQKCTGPPNRSATLIGLPTGHGSLRGAAEGGAEADSPTRVTRLSTTGRYSTDPLHDPLGTGPPVHSRPMRSDDRPPFPARPGPSRLPPAGCGHRPAVSPRRRWDIRMRCAHRMPWTPRMPPTPRVPWTQRSLWTSWTQTPCTPWTERLPWAQRRILRTPGVPRLWRRVHSRLPSPGSGPAPAPAPAATFASHAMNPGRASRWAAHGPIRHRPGATRCAATAPLLLALLLLPALLGLVLVALTPWLLGPAPVPSVPGTRPLAPTARGAAPLGCPTSHGGGGAVTVTGSGATAHASRPSRPPGASGHGSAGVPRCASGAHARARDGEAARKIRTRWAGEGGRAGQLAARTAEAAPPAGRPAPHGTAVAAPAGQRERERASDEHRRTPDEQREAAPDSPGADEPSVGRAWPVGGPDAGARPEVVRGWDPPSSPYAAGHRGVDLAARPGGTVRAAAAGRVTFAGSVAGRPVLVIELDGTGSPPLRITYEPVRPEVRKGDRVTAGQPVGTLDDGRSHCPSGCLHWGLRRGDRYLDPLSLLPAWMLRGGPSRLLPVFGVPEPHGTAPSDHTSALSPEAERPATPQAGRAPSDPDAGSGSGSGSGFGFGFGFGGNGPGRAATVGGSAHRSGAPTDAPETGGADASRADTEHTGTGLAGGGFAGGGLADAVLAGGGLPDAVVAGGGLADAVLASGGLAHPCLAHAGLAQAGRTGAGRATAHGTADRPPAEWAGHRATAPAHPAARHRRTGVVRGTAPALRTPPELAATGPDAGLPAALSVAGALITAAWWAHHRLHAGPRGPAPSAPHEATGTQEDERGRRRARRQGL